VLWLAAVAHAMAQSSPVPPVPLQEMPPTVEKPTGPVDTCITAECHPKIVSGRFLHGPTAQEECDACHVDEDVTKHTYKLVVPESELCSSCHTRSERTVVHKPVSDKECGKCHDPHGSQYPMQLLADPSGALCLPCHKREAHGLSELEDDRTEMAGSCNVCHMYHSSWEPNLLPSDEQELCLSCHQDLWFQIELLGGAHAPVLDQGCLDCHDAHRTRYPAQLKADVREVCYSCHDHDDIRKQVETSPVVHGVMTTEESCNACHVGHASEGPYLLAGSEKDLCLSCHNEPLTLEDGRVLSDMACLLKQKPRHHGPIRDGECRPCHDPHASAHSDLLTMAYPQEFYAPFKTESYALCFECHIEELALVETGYGVTEFRDQDQNLHFVHVNKEKRGRTCLTCHEVHASTQAFHMRDRVLYGPRGWEIEIQFTKLPNGGSCAPGCHDAMSYDRGDAKPKTPRAGLKPEYLE
jgi:predicted CXXCH cytochrome family protein